MQLGRHEKAAEAYERGHRDGYEKGYVEGRLAKAREMMDERPKPHPGVLKPVMEQTADAPMAEAYGVEVGAPVRVVRDMSGGIMGVYQTGPVFDPYAEDTALD